MGRRFTDADEMPIQVMSKLYPWEWMVREEFGVHVSHRYHPPSSSRPGR